MKDTDQVSRDVLHVALKLRRELGPGLLESVYGALWAVFPVHAKQLLTYPGLSKQPVGLLINFGGEMLKEGVRRLVNTTSLRPLRLCANQNPRR